ncbi:hypothetical protein GGF46_003625 [Coemansia sp. RSA 552]|nr:hypothetical protein GGF46_003625 [Coemansia sp. RSA 552]
MNLDNYPCTRPRSEWGLDPLFWAPAKLFVRDLCLALPSSSASVFFIGHQRVVRSVDIVGIIVAVDTRSPKVASYHGK